MLRPALNELVFVLSKGLVDVMEAGEDGIWVSHSKGSRSTVIGVNITRQSRFCPI